MLLSELIAPAFYELHGELRAGRYSEYMLRGGRGSGKSSFVSLEILLGLLKDPQKHAIVYRRVAATLRESAYSQMLWAARQLGMEEMIEARLSTMELRLIPTGQRILFRGCDDPGKSKSIKLKNGSFGYLWFEEAAEFSGMADVRSIKASILRGRKGAVMAAANQVASAATNRIRSALKIHSPSKVSFELGEYFGAGFAGGVAASIQQVQAGAREMSAGAAASLNPQAARISGEMDFGGMAAAMQRAVQDALGGTNLVVPLHVDGVKLGEASIRGINRVTRSAGRLMLEI